MKLNDISEPKNHIPTDKMVAFYEKRTKEHIDRVAACLRKYHDTVDFDDDNELLERADTHDKSKYGPEERIPYIWLTEFHRCKNSGIDFEYPDGMKDKVSKATEHHITTNRHHPEYHDSPSDMTDIDIIEMVCDWTAMAQELGENDGSAKGWADKNISTKWDFTDDQVEFIYSVIKELDKKD